MEERWLSKRKKRSDSLKILMDDTLTLKEGSLNSIDEVKEMFPSCLKECELVRYVLSGDNLRLFVVYDIEEEHHHDHEEEHSCGGNCGSCGGCGGHRVMLEGKNAGKICKVHYKGTFNDGAQFDSSYDRGEPLEFICGAGMMIKGFDAAVVDMEVGQVVDIHLMPEEAYGMPDPNAIMTFEIEQLQGSEDLTVGQQVYLSNAMGQPFPVKVVEKDEKTITLDANHEMAGKELNFRIELVEVK